MCVLNLYFEVKNIDFVGATNSNKLPLLNTGKICLGTMFTILRAYLPNAEVHIYGAYVNQQIQELHNKKEGFIIKGFAENAEEVVGNARVVLAALRFGAGIKGKLTKISNILPHKCIRQPCTS